MNGAHRILEILATNGIDTVFTNPGTSEMHLVGALEASPEIHTVLGLSETVVTGAADGYARMTRRPAATLLHLGPGLANGWANLHNARRARTPIIGLIGDHALDHLALDAPLTSDIAALAGALGPVFHPTTAAELTDDLTEAVVAAGRTPGRVVNAIIPADLAWGPASPEPSRTVEIGQPTIAPSTVKDAARAIRTAEAPALLVGGWAASGEALESAARIAAATRSALLVDTFVPRLDHGIGRPSIRRLPYHADAARALLSSYDTVVCVGTAVPVPFFAYPNQSSRLIGESATTVVLDGETVDPSSTLDGLIDELGGAGSAPVQRNRTAADRPTVTPGSITPRSLATAVAATITEGAVLIDEAISSAGGLLGASRGTAPHVWLQLTGGAIGQALPLAVGAATGAPDRRITAVVGDGSAMYSLPALWTLAKENLDVTIVICTNRRYAILDDEWQRTGAAPANSDDPETFSLRSPDIDITAIANGFGVDARTVTDAGDLATELALAAGRSGPTLIDAVMYAT